MNIRELPEWGKVHALVVSHNYSISIEVGSVEHIETQNKSVGWGRIEDLPDDSMGIPQDIVNALGKLARRIRRKFLGSDIRAAGVGGFGDDLRCAIGVHLIGDADLKEAEWARGEDSGLKMEVAETLKSLEDLLEEADYQSARKHLLECHPDFDSNIDSIVRSLREEDEFALMCRLMGTCTSIVRLDQKHVISGDYSVPDFLASFSPGCDICGVEPNKDNPFRCFVDVKTRYENPDKMKIGSGDLSRLRNYARQFDLPLLFAVRFTKAIDFAFWVLVEDNDPALNKISVPLDTYSNGVRQVLWNEKFFQVKPGIELEATYFKLQRNASLQHLDHGPLSHLTIVNHGKRSTVYDQLAVFCQVFFSMSGVLTDVRTEYLGACTTDHGVTAGDSSNPFSWSTADVIHTFNSRTTNRSGGVGYPASQALLPKGKTGIPPMDRQQINTFLDVLQRAGLITFVGHGTPESHKEICKCFNNSV